MGDDRFALDLCSRDAGTTQLLGAELPAAQSQI